MNIKEKLDAIPDGWNNAADLATVSAFLLAMLEVFGKAATYIVPILTVVLLWLRIKSECRKRKK